MKRLVLMIAIMLLIASIMVSCKNGDNENNTSGNEDNGNQNAPVECQHSWDVVITEPTCQSDGYVTKTCAVCGVKTTESGDDKLDHDFISKNFCLMCGEASPYIRGSDGLFYTSNGDGTCYVSSLGICEDKNIVIPSTAPNGERVISIGCSLFAEYGHIESIYISEGVSEIGAGAFDWCYSLHTVVIPSTVTIIGDSALACERSLVNIFVSDDNPVYSDICGILYSKDGKTLLKYTSGRNDSIFVVPEGVTAIGDSAFALSLSLTEVVLPESVKEIGVWAFSGCKLLERVNIPSGVKRIEDGLFGSCFALKKVRLPDGIEYIGYSAFSDCQSLEEINIPEGVKHIGEFAFNSCQSITSIVIPGSVEEIYDYTFFGCISLTSVEISEGVKTIPSSAFGLCSSLASVYIPSTVTLIDSDSFDKRCIENIYVSEGNQSYKDIGGNLYSKDGKTLFFYCGGKRDGRFVIPNGVTTIDDYAFCGVPNLCEIVIPESVTTIGIASFYYIESLTTVYLPKSLNSLGEEAFYACNNISDVYFGGTEEQFESLLTNTKNHRYLTKGNVYFNYVIEN